MKNLSIVRNLAVFIVFASVSVAWAQSPTTQPTAASSSVTATSPAEEAVQIEPEARAFVPPAEIGTYDKVDTELKATEKPTVDFPASPENKYRGSNAAIMGVFSDDVAWTIDGQARTAFLFGENFDLDKNHGAHTLNYVQSRAYIKPSLWVSERFQLVTNLYLLPDIRWGGDAEWRPEFKEGYLRFITAGGVFSLGRQNRSFGLGLAYSTGKDSIVPFGFLHNLNTEDRIQWDAKFRLGSVPIRTNLSFSWIEEPSANGILSKSDRLRYGLGLGADPANWFAVDTLLLFDNQNSTNLQIVDFSLYTDLKLGNWLQWQTEAGLRIGTSELYKVYEPLSRSISNPSIRHEGYRAKSQFAIGNTRTRKGVSFDGTKVSTLFSTGQREANPFARNIILLSGTDESACGCLIGGNYAQRELSQAWLGRALKTAGAAADENVSQSLQQATKDNGAVDGLIVPSAILAINYAGFHSKLGFFYLRSARPAETRVRLSDNGTTTIFDDIYKTGSNLGYELDVALSYHLFDHIEVGLDAGIFFAGELLDVKPSSNGPAYMLLPRLTVLF